MLPKIGYIVAQAGVDSRPSPSPSMYTAAPLSSPPALTPLQQKQQPTTHSAYMNNNAPILHQKVTYQQQQSTPPPLISSSQEQQQPIYPSYPVTASPWMYSTSASIHGPTKTEYHTQYYSSNYGRGYSTTVPPPLPPPPPYPPTQPIKLPQTPSISTIWQTSSSSSSITTTPSKKYIPSSPIYEQQDIHLPPTSHWHQEDPFELNDSKMMCRLRECNDVMEWMDHDFKEQRDEMYQEKLQTLQNELKSIQEGDHAVFQEQVADLEMDREQTISGALCFATYQQTVTKQDLDMDMMMIEEEYKDEKRHLDETIMLVIDDYRKHIKDNRGDVDMGGLFEQVLDRLQQKKQLRKRNTTMANGNTNNNNGSISSPSNRQETSSRGRRLKNTTIATPHNINAPISLQEEEDMETEYLNMKGTISKRNTTTSRR